MKKKYYVLFLSITILVALIAIIYPLYQKNREDNFKKAFVDNYYIFGAKSLYSDSSTQGNARIVHFTNSGNIQILDLSNAYNYYVGQRDNFDVDLQHIKSIEQDSQALGAQIGLQSGIDTYVTYINLIKHSEYKAQFTQKYEMNSKYGNSFPLLGNQIKNSSNQMVFLSFTGNNLPYSGYRINFKENSDYMQKLSFIDIYGTNDGSLINNAHEKALKTSGNKYLYIKLRNDSQPINPSDISSLGSSPVKVKDLFKVAYDK